MGCKKAQGFLETNAAGTAAEVVDATKKRFGRDEALELAKAADRVVAGKGKKVVVFDMKKAPPDDETGGRAAGAVRQPQGADAARGPDAARRIQRGGVSGGIRRAAASL